MPTQEDPQEIPIRSEQQKTPPESSSTSVSSLKSDPLKPLQNNAASADKPTTRPAAAAITDAKRSVAPAKKPTMSSRIGGIFRREQNPDVAKDAKQAEAKKGKKEKNVSVNGSTTSRQKPGTTSPKLNGTIVPNGTSANAGSAGSASSSIHNADTISKPPEVRLDEHGNPKRFWTNDDGTHEHYLKGAKRHQKLKDLLRNWWDKKKGDKEQEKQQQQQQQQSAVDKLDVPALTLIHDWATSQKNESKVDKASSDLQGGPAQTQSLVEKYGRCQEIVGHGAFGIVRVAHKLDPKDPKKVQYFAVKEFHKRPNENAKKYQKRLTSEFCLSSSMAHPNVIKTLDLLKDDKGDYCEVMEYCAGGDLYTLILAAGYLDPIESDCYFKQLMRGVEYMHDMGVAHRDLKPENLLLTSHGCLKITDFGNGECFQTAWEEEPHMTGGLCGSAPYIAPEEYIDIEFSPSAVDVWACGVIYMAMRTGRHLWRVAQKGEDEFYTRYLDDRKEDSGFRPIEVLRRRQCRNVIYSILDPNPVRRLTAKQVLQSEWVNGIKVCEAGTKGL